MIAKVNREKNRESKRVLFFITLSSPPRTRYPRVLGWLFILRQYEGETAKETRGKGQERKIMKEVGKEIFF
jgi:hypothetical protein